jgi:predicted alpha/beta-hydrolase family hydrolase
VSASVETAGHGRALILFAPGAGAPSSSAWMTAWAARLAGLGEVVSFDYPYVRERRRAPDRLPVLVAAHRAALEAARGGRAAGPVVLAGKSMGSRVGCHVALEEQVDALVCLGYPLRGRRGELRDQVLLALETPVLFVQGTRDPLCPIEELEAVRARMRAPSSLHRVEGGDHGLVVGRRALQAVGERQEDVDRRTLEAIQVFLAARLGASSRSAIT